MAYVKNCNPGKITMDLPSSNYIYELPLLSIGDVHGPFNLSLIFNQAMAKNDSNPFDMAVGYKLNIHKVLNFDDPNALYLLDTNGNRVTFYEDNGSYFFTDDSQRILRAVDSTLKPYVIENPDFSLEYYNKDGRIVSVVDKYGVEVLEYAYNTSKKLNSITFRGNKLIQFTYSGGKMSKVSYQGSTYSTTLSLDANSTTVNHYSDETYNLTYTENVKFQASTTVTENSTTVTNTVKAENTSTKTVKITKLIAGNTVDTTTYAFPDVESYPGEKFNQVEITNNDGVKTRVQYQFGKPLYSYEIGSDAEFYNNRFAGTVNLLAAQGHPNNNGASGKQTYKDGISMTVDPATGNWRTDVSSNGNLTGYYTVSGWIRAKSAGAADDNAMIIGRSDSEHIIQSPIDLYPLNQWKYFSLVFYASANTLVAFPETGGSNIETKDFRVTFEQTGVVQSGDSSHTHMTEYLLTDGTTDIPFENAVFYDFNDATKTPIANVTPSDILRRKLKKQREGSCYEVYYNNCKGVKNVRELMVQCGNTNSSVINFDVVVRSYSQNNKRVSRMHIYERNDNPYIVLVTAVNDTQISQQELDINQDVIRTTQDGVTTTYTRDATGLVTKEVVKDLFERLTTYDTDSVGNPTVKMKDEFGKETLYTLDPVWGSVKSVSLPDGTLVTDTYDDDMCALTKRTFGSASGRSNSLTYSSGNLSGLTSGALAYGFTYSAGKLTGVSKNSTSVEAHVHTGNSKTESYYPKQSGALHSTISQFDKYGRLSKIDGVLSNTYDLSPSFTSAGALNATEDNGSALLAMTIDELAGQTTRYDYNERGLLEHQTVTAKSAYSNKISNEEFTYDDLGRLVDYTATYDVANNKRVGATITYAKDTGTAAADHVVGTFNYKVNGTSKAVTTNTFDDYNRLKQKTITFGSKTFTRTINYGATRVNSVQDKLSTTNLGKNAYTYDSLGRILKDEYTSSKSSSDNKKYTYDQYGQLVREDNQGLAKTFVYAYNNIGNLTSVKAYNYTTGTVSGTPVTTSFGYSADKLTSFGGSSISYNTMGCPTSYDGMSATWSKGKLSRLSSGTLASGTTNYTYSYNGFGQRVSKTYSFLEGTNGLNPVQTGQVINYSKKYYYDHAGRLIAETINKSYYHASATVEHIVYLYDENSIVGIDYTSNGATYRYFFQRNLQGDVTAIFNTSGTLMAKYLYDAWGNCTISSETTNYAVANANPIRYRGYYYDDDTGLYYCNARYYSPKWRRFISPANAARLNSQSVNGLNLYIYANNNPTNVVYSSSNTGCNYYGVANVPVARTANIASDETSHQQNIPLWVGSLITGASSIHGLVDSISSYLAGTADGLLSYIGASKLNSFQSGLGKYTNWLMGIGIGLDILSSVYNNYTNSNLTAGQKWASFGADVGYIAVKAGASYLAGLGVTKGAVALGYAAMGATLGASVGGVTIGFVGAIAIGAGVVVLGIIAGTILIAVLSDAADNWWESKKEEWFS